MVMVMVGGGGEGGVGGREGRAWRDTQERG